MDIPQPYADPTLNLALDTINKKKQAIIFANTKNSAEKTAEELAKKIKEKSPDFDELARQALKALSSPTKQCIRLAECLKKGIAFHHAGLAAKQRDLIEENFRNRKIRIIAATPTLAAGVDLPAFRVILKDLRRYGQRGLQYIPVLEYLQMAGRAGRPKFDDTGEAIIIASSEAQKDELVERYLHGEPEPIYSKLAVEPALRTYILSLIASGLVTSKTSLYTFFGKTFWAFQFKDMFKLQSILDRMMECLEEWEFIISSSSSEEFSDFRSASDLKEEKYRATILGKRVAELYVDPYTAHFLVTVLQKAASKGGKPFAFLHVISTTLEMRPLLRTRMKEADKIQETLLTFGDDLLVKEPSIYEDEYEEFQNAVKTALFFHEWIEEKNEEYLLEEFNIRPGEIRAKLDIADWLIYCQEEIARILSFKSLLPELKKLRVRLKSGVKEELLPLLRFKGIGRVRARRLFKNGIKDIKDVKEADITKLSQILGNTLARDVKKQVGQEVHEIVTRKRKGQTGLGQYE